MDVLRSIFVWIAGLSYMVVLFIVTFIIWVVVLPFDNNRKVIHWILIFQSLVLVYILPIWKISIKGRKKALKGVTYVIISNHQSLLDILFVNCLRYRYKWISKIEVMKFPFLGWYLRMAGYISVNRSDKDSKEEMLEKSYRCLKQGTSIMIFPEGTRSPDSEIGFFKRGAFQLALKAGIPILPVVIDGTGGVLPKHGLIFSGGHKVKVRVFDPVLPESFGTDDPEVLALYFSTFMKEALMGMRAVSDM